MPHFVTDRIVTGLHRAGALLLILDVLVLLGGIGWTTSADALVMATAIAPLTFGVPAALTIGLAMWLDHQAAKIEGRGGEQRAVPRDSSARHPFREPFARTLSPERTGRWTNL